MLCLRAIGIDEIERDVFGFLDDKLTLILPLERGAANRVDRFALLVHHVVVFEQVFAGVEILRFDRLLRLFDAARNHFRFDGYAFGHAEAKHQRLDALAAEDAHEIVFERKEEARRTGVPLTTGATAKLIVDAASFMALGAENVQAAHRDDFIVFGFTLLRKLFGDGLPLISRNLKNLAFVLEQDHRSGDRLRRFAGGIDGSAVLADDGRRGSIRQRHFIFEEIVARHLLGISTEKNVGAAARHVGRNGDSAFAPGLRDDARFALMLLGVEHLVRDAFPLQDFSNRFGFFDRNGADENGLAALVVMSDAVVERIVFLQDAVDDRFEFFFLGAVDDVGMLFADERSVRRNRDDVEVVDLAEFGGFGFRRTGHAGELFVHTEIILKSDRGERLIFALDFDSLFCFDRLMQAIGPTAARHLATGKFVDDDDFDVFDNVIDVVFVERVRAQRLIDVVHHVDVGGIGHVREAEKALALIEAFFGQRRLAMLFVERVVDVLNQLGNDFVDLVVLVGGFFGGTGNDERGARFVDQDRIDFVNDAEVVAALDTIREVVLHVVAQIVEAELVVGAVGDVGVIGVAALRVVEIVDDDTDGEAERAIERAHPLRVATSEIVVDGDDVDAAARKGVECGGKRGYERLAFSGFHFGDLATVENHAADELHIEVAHVERAATGFANESECGNDGGLEGLHHQVFEAGIGRIGVFERSLDLLFESEELRFQLFVAERFDFGFARIDGRDERLQFLDVALVLGADESRDYAVNNLCCIHEFVSPFPILTEFDRTAELQRPNWRPGQHFIVAVWMRGRQKCGERVRRG